MIFKNVSLILVSFSFGVVTCWLSFVPDMQRYYSEGRESVLSEKVTIGHENTPCSVRIPIAALADMVSAGVIEWYKICKGDKTDD